MSRPTTITRRQLLAGTAAIGGGTLLTACGGTRSTAQGAAVSPTSSTVAAAEQARRTGSGTLRPVRLRPAPVRVDLGGRIVTTWAYGDSLPGREIRLTAGDTLRADVHNALPVATSVHWHGVRLRNDMDGVPGITTPAVGVGGDLRYEFTVPDPGTYWFHPHSGLQIDRGLYGPLIVEDPREPLSYDHDWTVVLDDWTDGVGRSPETILAGLQRGTAAASGEGMGGMDGMDMGGMAAGHGHSMGGMSMADSGDVQYPLYLLNGRVAASPATFTGRPGQRARIRFLNAGSDTVFTVALGGHRLQVTHTDGFPVEPVIVDAVTIGMGERYDVLVSLGDGAFPLVGRAEGKNATVRAVVRTSPNAAAPRPDASVPELSAAVLSLRQLRAAAAVALPDGRPDRSYDLRLTGDMAHYRWTINGKPFDKLATLPLRQGELVRLVLSNTSMMAHPMHLHGHTFAVRGVATPGPRKDTVNVVPMSRVTVQFRADNPGQWVVHCHNIYHAESGMMARLSYQA